MKRAGSASHAVRLASVANATTRPFHDVVTLESTGEPIITGQVALIGLSLAASSAAARDRGAGSGACPPAAGARLERTIGAGLDVRAAIVGSGAGLAGAGATTANSRAGDGVGQTGALRRETTGVGEPARESAE